MIEKEISKEVEKHFMIEVYVATVDALEKQIPYKPTQSTSAWKCKCGKLYVNRDWNYCPNCGQRVVI